MTTPLGDPNVVLKGNSATGDGSVGGPGTFIAQPQGSPDNTSALQKFLDTVSGAVGTPPAPPASTPARVILSTSNVMGGVKTTVDVYLTQSIPVQNNDLKLDYDSNGNPVIYSWHTSTNSYEIAAATYASTVLGLVRGATTAYPKQTLYIKVTRVMA